MEITRKYMSKEEAAKALGKLSARRVLELAKEGQLESARVRDPNTNQTVVRILSKSVDEYLERKKAQVPIPDPIDLRPAIARAIAPAAAGLVRLRDGYANGAIAPAAARLWLTLEEAADYSGLPAGALFECIERKALKAMNVGRRRGGQWRIRRLDLDQFAG